MQLARSCLQASRAGLQLGGSGVELLRTGADFGDFVLDHGQGHQALHRIRGCGLQQFEGLREGRRSGAGCRVIAGAPVALELDRAGGQFAGTRCQPGRTRIKLRGAVGQVVLGVAGGRGGQRGRELHGSGGKLLRAVVDLVDAGGEFVVDVGFDLDGARGQLVRSGLELLGPGSKLLADPRMDLFGTGRELAGAGVRLAGARREFARTVLQLRGSGGGLPGAVLEPGGTIG